MSNENHFKAMHFITIGYYLVWLSYVVFNTNNDKID